MSAAKRAKPFHRREYLTRQARSGEEPSRNRPLFTPVHFKMQNSHLSFSSKPSIHTMEPWAVLAVLSMARIRLFLYPLWVSAAEPVLAPD
ncbi:hypothetical protein TWF679_004156 [Orbilia oligospora]|uniref:Uncharacterized protein n=1 Tax=Orbilia oligospora TaxID=2813651 RepID=A0A8H8VM42_ORBOL|nr:hypothetical protein TWF679_004156 [Orbilia oligospora]